MTANRIVTFGNRLLRRRGMELARSSALYPFQRHEYLTAPTPPATLTAEERAYLVPGNPRLEELRTAYAKMDKSVTTPLIWVDNFVSAEELQNFRGDNAYVHQLHALQYNRMAYALSTYYYLASPAAPLLDQMLEDGAYGARCFAVAGRQVSRDLLDSVQEIDFLKRHLGAGSRPLKMLDIGAGYGRLAHRITEVLGGSIEVRATDGFAVSSFLAEFYLRRRRSRAQMVPLHQIEKTLSSTQFDVATNIHSFSECTTQAIDWWTARLAAAKVGYLMVVPNGWNPDLQVCQTNDGHDMEAIFAAHGYHPVAREPRYADPLLQQFGVDPAQLCMFKLV